jgi:hypothetical protein
VTSTVDLDELGTADSTGGGRMSHGSVDWVMGTEDEEAGYGEGPVVNFGLIPPSFVAFEAPG